MPKERLELVLAYSSRSSSALKLCYLSRNLDGLEDQRFFDGAFCHEMGSTTTQGDVCGSLQRDFNLDGLEDQCFFDGAFATKWVQQPRETL